MDPELDQSISSILLEMNELCSLESASMMEQPNSFLHSDQAGGNAAQPQTKTKAAGNQESQEDALLSLDAIFPDIEEIINESSFPALKFVTPSPMSAAPSEVKLEPVIPQSVHGLKECKPSEDLSVFSSQPKESSLTPLDTSVFDYLSHLSFSNLLDSILIPDQLPSFQEPFLQEDKNNYRILETPHPIPEYPVQHYQQSELLDELQPNNLAPASQAAQAQNITLFSSEETQQTAILLKNKESLNSQHVFFQMQLGLHEMEPKSARIPQMHSMLSQSPTLGVAQRVLTEEQDLDSFRCFPRCPPQAFCPAQHPHLPSLQAYGPPRSPFFLTSSYYSAAPYLHASQTPNMPYSNNIHSNARHVPLVPTVSANLMHSGHQFTYRCQQPGLQPCYMLPNPFIPDRIFNMTNITFGNCPPLRSELNCIQPAAVSHLNMNSSPSLLHMNSPFPVNISGREPNLHVIPPKLNGNFRLWQAYCKVARTVYTSSPDLEAFACFFIQIIHSLHVHCPDLPFLAAVRKATLEWEMHSNFDRMKYYEMAQKFIEFEKRNLKGNRAKQEPSEHSGNVLELNPCIVTDQAANINVQELAEKELSEYSEIMKDMESKVKGGSEIAKEPENVDDMEGHLLEYLNEICSQISVTEVAEELDMACMSSLLFSDSNTADMPVQQGVVDNAQDVPSATAVEPEACHSSNKTTAGNFSASQPKRHSVPETQSPPPLQSGLYVTEGRVHPTPPSFKIPNLPNQRGKIPVVAFPNRYVQVFPQTDKAHQCGFPAQQKDITQNTFQLLHPPPTDLPPFHSAPYQNASQWSQFVPEHPNSVLPVLVQGTVANSSDAFQNNLPHYDYQLNLLDVENKVNLLSSYTHETIQENFISKKDIAGIRPTFMCKNNNFMAPSSSTANSTFTEPVTVFQNESQFSLGCMSNIQKENQIGYKKDNLSVVPKIYYIGEIVSPKIDCNVVEMVPSTADCGINQMVPPAADCSAEEMVPPTEDCSARERIPPKAERQVVEMVPPTADCSVGNMVPPSSDCSVGVPLTINCSLGEMVLPKRDCCVREFVPPLIDFGVKVMGSKIIECDVQDSFFSESTLGGYKKDKLEVGIQKMKESNPDEQEGHCLADAVEQLCSDVQSLGVEYSDYSDKCQTEHLDTVNQLTEDETAVTQILDSFSSNLPSPTSARLQKVPLINTFTHKDIETCTTEVTVMKDKAHVRNSSNSLASVSPKGLGIFTASNSILGAMEGEVSSLKPDSETALNEIKGLVDNLIDWLIGIHSNDLPSESDIDASSIENLKSNRDEMKPLHDMARPTEAISQTVDDVLNDLIQETGELVPGQIDEVAGCSMHVNNPQYFHVSRSKSYTESALQVPQDNTDIVTQSVYVAVTNDQVNEMSNSKIKAYNIHEEPCITEVQTNSTGLESFMSACLDLATPSKILILGPDMSHELDREVDVEFPQQDIDKSNETNSPLEDTCGATATKEVMRTAREMIKETDKHEDKGTESDSDMSRENETNRVQSKQMMSQQTQSTVTNEKVAGEMGQITEMLEFNTGLEVGNGSRVEEIIAAGSLCTSEAELGQDGYTENIESEQHKHNCYSKDQIGVEESKNKVLDSIKRMETKTSGILYQSKCDRAKKSSPMGRKKFEVENETVKRSAVVQTQITDKPIERENIFKKEHRRLARQSLKKAETDIGQRMDKGNMVMKCSRGCKAVKDVGDVSSENQKKTVNAREKQTQDHTKGQRKENQKDGEVRSTFVRDTKRTRRRFDSLALEAAAAGTQYLKMKTGKPNTTKDVDTNQFQTERENVITVSESSTKPKRLAGRRRRNLDTSLVKDFEGVQIHTNQEKPNDLVGQKEKKQNTVVKARDRFGGHQKSRINKEERQTPRKSERVNNAKSNTIFVMNTRRTRRDFNSLASKDVARTQTVKNAENSNSEMDGDTKQPLVEGMKNIQAPEIKSSSNSVIVTGRGTRGKVGVVFVEGKSSSKDDSQNDHISTRSYNTMQNYNIATPEKQVGDRREGAGTLRRSKRTRKCSLYIKGPVKRSSADTEPRSEKTTRECSAEPEEAAVKRTGRKEGELKNTPKQHESAFPVTTEKVKEIEKESRGKKKPKYEQRKAKDRSGDKRTDERRTRSYTASPQCQVENKGKEMRESDGRNKSKNQIKETKMSGVNKVLRERQPKEAGVDLKEKMKREEERSKDAGKWKMTRSTVAGTTEGETGKQDMTTGILTRRKKLILEQNIYKRQKEKCKINLQMPGPYMEGH